MLIVGHHLQIREMLPSDSDFVVGWRNHPQIQRWLPSWQPLTRADHENWLTQRQRSGDLVLSYLNQEGHLLGQGSLYGFDRAGWVAEFGRVFFAPDHAQPFAVLESYYWVHRLAFDLLGLRRLFSQTVTDNRSALALLEATGYQLEGELPQHFTTPWGERRTVRVLGLSSDLFARGTLERKLFRGQSPQLNSQPWQSWLQAHRSRCAPLRSSPAWQEEPSE